MKNYLKSGLGWIVSIVFLYFVIRKIDWETFAAQLHQITVGDIALLSTIYLLGFAIRAVRCSILIPALSFANAASVVFIGYAVNNVLPARLGEFVRAKVSAKYAGTTFASSLSTVFVERILDGFTIVLLLIVSSASLELPTWAYQMRLFGMLLFSLLLSVVLLAGRFRSQITSRLPRSLITKQVTQLIDGTTSVSRSVGTTIAVVALSLAVWWTEGMMFYYAFHVFNFPLPMYASLFVLGVVNLGVLIPSSPGNIGTFQYFTTLALGIYAVQPSQATAYAIVLHGCQYAPVTIIGLLCLAKSGIRARDSKAT